MEKHDEVGILGGALEYIDSAGRVLDTRHYPRDDHEARLMLQHESPFVNSAVLMRREIMGAAGGYRKTFDYSEDYDLWIRMAKRCQLANLGDVVLKYRVHPEQTTCRKVRQQALAYLAVRALASSADNGHRHLLESSGEVTPEVLAALGVDEATLQRTLAAFYLTQIEGMSGLGEGAAALRLALEMLHSPRWEHIENRKRFIADNWLRAAGLHWGQGQFLQSLAATVRALTVRPIAAGRPLKRILHRLNDRLAAGSRLPRNDSPRRA